MTMILGFRAVLLSLCAVFALSLPAAAQQRIQIGELVQRIDRLESEVTRLRVAPRGSGADVARLDQIEQELRRLTGIIERLDFESRRADSAADKRFEEMDARLSAVENTRATAARQQAPPAATTDSSFASVTPPSAPFALGRGPVPSGPVADETTLPAFQPQATFQPQPDVSGLQSPAGLPPVQSGQSADALYDEGIRLLNVGLFDQAGASFEDLVASWPQDPKAGEAKFWLGDMHFKLGRYEQAASAFLDSFRNWPEGAKAPDSLLKLGMTLANIGKNEEACLSFRQVPARYPGASPSLLRRADIESQRNRCGS